MCNCEDKKTINMVCPDCDINRWAVQCSSYIVDADNYYTKPQIDEMLVESSGITEEEVDEKIASAKTEIEAEIPSLDGYATEQWVEDKHYISGVDLSDYALKSEIPTVPTDVSAFNNDAGYLTSHQSLSAYSTTEEMNTAIEEATSGKADTSAVTQSISEATSGLQQTLSASSGVKIVNNVIGLDVPVYKGSGTSSVSIGSENGTIQGQNLVKGSYSAGIGWGINTNNFSEVSFGGFNKSVTDQVQLYGSSGKTAFSVGNGQNNGYRHNALEIKQNGDVYIADTNASGEYYEKPMIKLQDVLQSLQDQINALSGNT